MPSDPVPAQDATSRKGIDFREALQILSDRLSQPNDHNHESPPPNGVSTGQTIDLTGGTKQEEKESEPTEDIERQRQKLQEERTQREVKIRQEMESMTVLQLLNTLMKAQSERVSTYREYDRGLDNVLKTANISEYPSVCARATASFSVLSDTINTIRSILDKKHGRNDIVKHIATLQKEEEKKLRLTAALHLDRMRERNEKLGGGGDTKVGRLLETGVETLKTQVAQCAEAITDALDEIRCILLDENEEE